MKVYVVGSQLNYIRMFQQAGHEVVTTIGSADLVQFCGGADVSPLLYRQLAHPATSCRTEVDRYEISRLQEAIEKDKPLAGICRGGQLLCAIGGGDLYQHVNNHLGNHEITDVDSGDSILVSSTHHQMMIMPDNGILLAYAEGLATTKESVDENGLVITTEDDAIDVEAMYLPDIKALCYQPHPELGPSPCLDYYFQLIERVL